MKQFVVNLELTSRCNRKCIVCPQGDPDFVMTRRDMPLEDLGRFLCRASEAAEEGWFVRETINAGYGEPFLHRRFDDAMALYDRFKTAETRKWGRRPDISLVTNGSAITKDNLAAACRCVDILKFSFPTSHPARYGRIMLRCPESGARLLDRAVESLRLCMGAYRDGRLPEFRVHISPPVKESHEDFPETVEFLTQLAAEMDLDNLRLVTFPATSNRGGTVRDEGFLNDFYRDYRRRYAGAVVNGVRLVMLSELRVFYPKTKDVIAVLRDRFPCIWKAGSLSIDSQGNYRFCINDAASRVTLGNLREDGLVTAYRRVREGAPHANCPTCNQNPAHMGDDLVQRLYSVAARARMRLGGPGEATAGPAEGDTESRAGIAGAGRQQEPRCAS